MPVDKEKIKKWIAALRSGKYKQGYRSFKPNESSYCCLGVACEVAGIPIYVNHGSDPYPELEQYYQLSTEFTNDLVDMNDSREYSFNQIADYIEKELLGV